MKKKYKKLLKRLAKQQQARTSGASAYVINGLPFVDLWHDLAVFRSERGCAAFNRQKLRSLEKYTAQLQPVEVPCRTNNADDMRLKEIRGVIRRHLEAMDARITKAAKAVWAGEPAALTPDVEPALPPAAQPPKEPCPHCGRLPGHEQDHLSPDTIL